MPIQSTIAWFHETFSTRQKTAELLRPELEENVLSSHDYELATRFLPGPRIDSQLVYGVGMSAGMYGYGSYIARPRWNIWKLRFASAGALLVGSAYGAFRQFIFYYRFANSLENPEGFVEAINHVDQRLGGNGRVGLALKEILPEMSRAKSNNQSAIHTQDVGNTPPSEDGWRQSQENLGDTSKSDSTRRRTRWDEIRAANSRSTGQSSWDVIRQSHERSRLSGSSMHNNGTHTTEADERAAAQAKFDALLEAERNRGQSESDLE